MLYWQLRSESLQMRRVMADHIQLIGAPVHFGVLACLWQVSIVAVCFRVSDSRLRHSFRLKGGFPGSLGCKISQLGIE